MQLPVFRASAGLNTRVPDSRLRLGGDTGVCDLAEAVNVVHDETGRLSKRRGYTLVSSGDHHSLFSCEDVAYVVKNGSLYSVNKLGVYSGIRADVGSTRMSFVSLGQEIYYTNSVINGVIRAGKSYAWPVGTYTGPDTYRTFSQAPIGSHLAYFSGRMIVAKENVLWFSEPWSPGLFDLASGFVQFNSDILMVKHMRNGIFVSDMESTWFLEGTDFKEFSQRRVAAFPALEGSVLQKDLTGYDIGLETGDLCAIWVSSYGLIAGLPDGSIIKLNDSRVQYPKFGRRGSSVAVGKNIYHHLF